MQPDGFMVGVVGINGAGKSTAITDFIMDWIRQNPKRPVYAHDYNKDYTKIVPKSRMITEETKDWGAKLSRQKNCLIILDEFKVIHPSNTPTKDFTKLLATFRKNRANIIYIVHNPKDILTKLIERTTVYYLYFTVSSQGTFQERLPCGETCYTASVIVNRYVKNYGKGTYPIFPYIEIDAVSEEINCINMDKEKVKLIIQT